MNLPEIPKDINTLINDVEASFGSGSENNYTNGEPTPTFKQWLSGYRDLDINEETVPLLREIYDTYVYNVPLPKDASVENYILQLEARKQTFEKKFEDFRKRVLEGKAQPMNFNPENGEIESEETYQDSIKQLQRKIDILQANQIC